MPLFARCPKCGCRTEWRWGAQRCVRQLGCDGVVPGAPRPPTEVTNPAEQGTTLHKEKRP